MEQHKFMDELLAPLFRHTYTTAAAAAKALNEPEVSRWIVGMVAKHHSAYPGLRREYPNRKSLVDHIVARLVEKIIARKAGDGGPGLATRDGGVPESKSGWVARIIRNLLIDELRRLDKKSILVEGAEDAHAAAQKKHDSPTRRPVEPHDAVAMYSDGLAPRPGTSRQAEKNREEQLLVQEIRKALGGSPARLVAFLANFYPFHLTLEDIQNAKKKSPTLFARTPEAIMDRLQRLGSGHGIDMFQFRRTLAWAFGCVNPRCRSWAEWSAAEPERADACLENLRKSYDRALETAREPLKKLALRRDWL